MLRLSLFAIFVASVLSSCYRPSAQQAFSDLEAIRGTWKATEGPEFMEVWKKQNDSLLVGLGLSMRDGDTVFTESLQISLRKGQLFYGARVGENPEFVLFELKVAGRNSWRFENHAHDYPNIIAYHLVNDSVLEAKTTNSRGKKEVKFHMKKIRQ